jgi:hypothetical protein
MSAHIRRLQQVLADLGPGRRRHLFHADSQNDARGARFDRPDALMHRRRTGGAGILDAGRALETQIRRGLQHQRGGKILRREARIEVTQHDLVDVLGLDTGVGQGLAGDAHDQAFDGLAVKLTEGGVGPTDNGCRHRCLPERRCCRTLVVLVGD